MTMLEKIKSCMRKTVWITTIDNETYTGRGWYIEDPGENPSNEYALMIRGRRNDVEGFYESEISTLEVEENE